MAISRKDVEEARERKERLGRNASYRRLGAMTGYSHQSVFLVLNNRATPFAVDREALIRKVSAAMDQIESEEGDSEEADGGTITAYPIS